MGQAPRTGQPPRTSQGPRTGQAPRTGQYPRTGQPPRTGQYPRSGQYPRTAQYPRSGQYPRTGQYPRSGQYPRTGQYRPDGQPAADNQPLRDNPPLRDNQPLRDNPPLRDSQPTRDGQSARHGRSGQLIRQRDAALPELSTTGGTQPIAELALDGLDSFARDLRALRAKAELDYPEMAERSHYTMKTLASAAGGLRLPTLPVAIAYVKACDGNETEWEERWHKLAEKLGPDKPDSDSEEAAAETGDPPEVQEPQPDKAADQGEVYVITSAKPREPGW